MQDRDKTKDPLPESFESEEAAATLSRETEEALCLRPNLPKAFIYVSSPLSMRLKKHDSHPLVTAWTMFETKQPRTKYRYTYCIFDPSKPDNFDEATEFLKYYVRKYDGRKIITDFDGIVPRLEASIPLSSNPMKKHKKEAKDLIVSLDDWARKSLSRLNRGW